MRILKYLLFAALVLVVLYALSWQINLNRGAPNWGVTFSEVYAKELNLDWKAAYLAVLDDLAPKNLRLIAYWQDLEPQKGKFDFSDLDWQINEAQQRGDSVVLAIGRRVPRWPECYTPDWAAKLAETDQEKEILNYLTAVVNHYKNFPSIKTWQIENEPLFGIFGNCPPPNEDFLKKEIKLVSSLDPSRQIMITDSGELSSWMQAASLTKVLGISLYRIVWSPQIGWWKHLYPPVYYFLHAQLVGLLFKTHVIISELQAEPWAQNNQFITQIPFNEQTSHFTPADLKSNLKFAQKTGIKDIYIWGVEWWYYRKINGDGSYWQIGKDAIKNGNF
ncbi:MAG: beta-galactosidase [Patescibacteria group bacterium]|nr:beta-galactosidase [Patescibacteria group bacterium]